uniref:Uncharacterized protein n=1 Tax=Hyaloperonospora arabidopsidis (strain Emoy2) TaxID=559515 RepID=M4C2Z7_HYAAE
MFRIPWKIALRCGIRYWPDSETKQTSPFDLDVGDVVAPRRLEIGELPLRTRATWCRTPPSAESRGGHRGELPQSFEGCGWVARGNCNCGD